MTCAWCSEPLDVAAAHFKLKGEFPQWHFHVACLEDMRRMELLNPVFDVEYHPEGEGTCLQSQDT
jgi:hypothetical protein